MSLLIPAPPAPFVPSPDIEIPVTGLAASGVKAAAIQRTLRWLFILRRSRQGGVQEIGASELFPGDNAEYVEHDGGQVVLAAVAHHPLEKMTGSRRQTAARGDTFAPVILIILPCSVFVVLSHSSQCFHRKPQQGEVGSVFPILGVTYGPTCKLLAYAAVFYFPV